LASQDRRGQIFDHFYYRSRGERFALAQRCVAWRFSLT
jgi:hypothetical protein